MFQAETPSSTTAGSDAAPAAKKPTPAQRRADALVAMAEASLGGGSEGDVSSADRYQVVAHIDADALEAATTELAAYASTGMDAPLPLPVRAAVAGFMGASVSPATVRRMACDGSLVPMIVKNGEPIAVGRKTRSWNSATRRAVLARDGCCAFPGCGATRHLDVHHVHGWAFGGETSAAGGVTLCRTCHTRVHDEGWRITRVELDAATTRHSESQGLLDAADDRTRAIVRRLDARRPAFRFERSSSDEP